MPRRRPQWAWYRVVVAIATVMARPFSAASAQAPAEQPALEPPLAAGPQESPAPTEAPTEPPPPPRPQAPGQHDLLAAEVAEATAARVKAPEKVPLRLVVANTYGLNFGITPVPSVEVALFLGASLPLAPRGVGQWLAVGLQHAVSFGRADGGYGTNSDDSDRRGLVSYRPLLTVHGIAGPRARLMYGGGLGPLFFLAKQWYGEPMRSPAVGLDLEGRIGGVFTPRASTRIQGIVGVQVRVSGVFHAAVPQPQPQFGMFLGFTRAPYAPAKQRWVRGEVGDGRNLLIGGAVTMVAAVPMIIAGVCLNLAGAFSEGTPVTGGGATYPLLGLGTASLLASIPMLAVGAYRRARSR